MTSSRTVLIDPSCLVRQGLKHLLADTRFAVEVEFSTIEQAVGDTVASGLVIIGKASMEPGDLQLLRETYSEARMVVLASDLTVDALRDAMNAGADGFLMNDVSPEALLQSLELVMLGEKVFPTNLAAMLLDLSNAPSPLNSVRGVMTPPRARDPSSAGDRLQQQDDRQQARYHRSDRQNSPEDSAAQD